MATPLVFGRSQNFMSCQSTKDAINDPELSEINNKARDTLPILEAVQCEAHMVIRDNANIRWRDASKNPNATAIVV